MKYEFRAKTWQHSPPGGWCFVALPQTMSEEIRSMLKVQEEGWGRLKAIALIGKTEWDTALWFDTKSGTYLLPLKSEIRKKESISAEEELMVTVWL
ncbi:DUF1905 domain-containing protein [Flavobacterium silvisoli]|uniref:DUF1905 domain-containing protein n=1 Tax=Flavobacterium silvisoli TaxID=2529433 RepID=A0A4Q9Z4D2_9FLAO|nr:DUF1905 domain-containing protein [Flavobacterium silvisoli]